MQLTQSEIPTSSKFVCGYISFLGYRNYQGVFKGLRVDAGRLQPYMYITIV